MKNNIATDIINEVYNEVITNIKGRGDDIDESEIIDFLHEIAQKLFANSFHVPLDLHSQQLTFDQEYEALAKSSILSYQNTNNAMESIHKLQGDLLDQDKVPNEKLFNSEAISKQFEDIQINMDTEITKANQTISDLHKQLRDLEKKSRIDALTKTFNRQAMNDFMQHKCDQNPHAHNFHLMILDIDDFKEVNDTFGHVAGDKVLIFLANIFKKTLRDGDPVFRYGGEEFVIILNRTDKDGAILVAKRIIELVRSNKLLFKNRQMSITLSVGLAHCRIDDTPTSIIERADKALYEAKRSGKDQLQIEKG
jgi:diguanylate cyclase (GGDEF)-like protein